MEKQLTLLCRHVGFAILLPITLFILAPLFCSLALILHLVREFLNLLKKALKLDYGEFLVEIDGFFSRESPYENPQIVCNYTYLLDGVVDLSEAREKMASVVEKHTAEGYPQMKQFLTTWLGFDIWKPVANFRIEDHVVALEPDEVERLVGNRSMTEDNVAQLIHELSSAPFPKGCSPWHLYVCPGASKRIPDGIGSWLILRFHHTLGDGVISERILAKIFNTEGGVQDVLNTVQKGSSVAKCTWSDAIKDTVTSIYDLAHAVVYRTDFNAVHKPWTGLRRKYFYETLSLPIEKVKAVRRAKNVSFSSVICGIQTLALKRFFVSQGASVPDSVHVVVSVPTDVYNTKALNNISFIMLKLPTGEADTGNICKQIDKDFQEQKSLGFSNVMHKIASVVALMPQSLKSVCPAWRFSTYAGSNFPFGNQTKKFGSHKVVYYTGLSQLPGNFAMWFWSVGYQEQLYITIGISRDIITDRSGLKQYLTYVEEELDKWVADA